MLATLRNFRPRLSFASSLRTYTTQSRLTNPRTTIMQASIILNETEATFLNLLDEFAQTYVAPEQKASGSSQTVECRIAGGWVRDKLLNLPSSDLDIALSTASGHSFAVAFSDFLTTPPRNVTIGSIGKVAANPEQSKHLETATTRIMGLECDFVGLRSESYAEGSRIPDVVQLGTPLEDALRRDLTINSLFYNVHTRTVEDWTEHGLPDLKKKIARTPLPPLQTFQDDPLRILRLVRFASRFALTVESEVKDVLKSGGGPGGVLEALRTKISKERVGIEVYKMLKGPDPLHSLTLINDLNLYDSIFTIPPPAQPTPPQSPTSDALACARILRRLMDTPELLHPTLRTEAVKRLDVLWLACAVAPFREGDVKAGKKEVKALEFVVAEGLKLSSDQKLMASHLHACAELFAHPELDRYAGPHERSAIGTLLSDSRAHSKPGSAGKPSLAHWASTMTFGIVMRLLPLWDVSTFADETQAMKIVQVYTRFVDRAQQLGLDRAIEEPKVIDGKAIASLLDLPPSKVRMVVQRAAEAWQLDHPEGRAADCEAWLKQAWVENRVEWEKEAGGGWEGNRKKAKKA